MNNTELKDSLLQIAPALTVDDAAEWLTVEIESLAWLPFAQSLRNRNDLNFDFLFCITCVDWKTHLSMVYHLSSYTHGHILVVKSKLDRTNPEIESVTSIWKTADFHERESYDLFGVKFLHHPDLRRLFLTDEWVGWPLRKDYDDPVNMIKL